MINVSTFGEEHIRELQRKSGNDPILIERAIYAFGLLEALVRVGMPFTFKGGTCLMVLLEHPKRLSTDIDIICDPGLDVDMYIEKASEIFPFERFEEQKRVGKNNIVKRHFKFYYRSPVIADEFYILLDILFEETVYSSVVEKEICNDILIVDSKTQYTVRCILGDKLTAFAPHTIGVPLGVGKEQEIMKQLYDVATLIDYLDDFGEVKTNYKSVAKNEIAYRGISVDWKDCLQDTIQSCICIIGKGNYDKDDFRLYMQGAKAVSSHIYEEKYSGEKAAFDACKVLCLAACVLSNCENMPVIHNADDYLDRRLEKKEYGKLSYIRKLDLKAFGYLVEGMQILEK